MSIESLRSQNFLALKRIFCICLNIIRCSKNCFKWSSRLNFLSASFYQRLGNDSPSGFISTLTVSRTENLKVWAFILSEHSPQTDAYYLNSQRSSDRFWLDSDTCWLHLWHHFLQSTWVEPLCDLTYKTNI